MHGTYIDLSIFKWMTIMMTSLENSDLHFLFGYIFLELFLVTLMTEPFSLSILSTLKPTLGWYMSNFNYSFNITFVFLSSTPLNSELIDAHF